MPTSLQVRVSSQQGEHRPLLVDLEVYDVAQNEMRIVPITNFLLLVFADCSLLCCSVKFEFWRQLQLQASIDAYEVRQAWWRWGSAVWWECGMLFAFLMALGYEYDCRWI